LKLFLFYFIFVFEIVFSWGLFTKKQDAILSNCFKLYVLILFPGKIWFCEWLDMFGCTEGRGRAQSL